MLPGTVIAAAVTYLVMVAAFFLSRRRWLHIPLMLMVMVFDLVMPFYLYATRDWYGFLIEDLEILSFLVWMHFMLVLGLYALYVLQVITGYRLWQGSEQPRPDHGGQGKALLLVRALVIGTGALLAEPQT